MDPQGFIERVAKLQDYAQELARELGNVESMARTLAAKMDHPAQDPFIFGLTVFVLAVFVGYYVVWRVTPALHSPLMSVTNAISSVVIVGALLAGGTALSSGVSSTFGFFAVILASINIFGGFIITQRMLEMFSKSK